MYLNIEPALALLKLLFAASILIVPDDFQTIGQAIRSSHHGDTILVKPGTYFERIDYSGKHVMITSEAGPEYTVDRKSVV